MQRALGANWRIEWRIENRQSATSQTGSERWRGSGRPAGQNLLSRQVLSAGPGDPSNGGGLLLRIRDERTSSGGRRLPATAAWVFRYTAASGSRRAMGLGVLHRGSVAQAGDSLTGARDQAHRARGMLRQGLDPIAEREKVRDDHRQAEVERKVEKARELDASQRPL